MTEYKKPGWVTKNLLNPMVALLTRLGVSVRGSRVLRVRGRKSGEWRSTPVNPLSHDGDRYLVAPRGETQWVRNLRAADGKGELVYGRNAEPFQASELTDEEKPQILRDYLRKWKAETGQFFEGVTADSSEEDIRRIAPNHPVFRIQSG